MKADVAARTGILMATVITLLAAVGAGLAVCLNNNWPYIVVAVGTAATCFFGLLILTQPTGERWKVTEESMRTTIAGTIVVVYLVVVGIVAFFIQGPRELPGITQTMMTSFTTRRRDRRRVLLRSVGLPAGTEREDEGRWRRAP